MKRGDVIDIRLHDSALSKIYLNVLNAEVRDKDYHYKFEVRTDCYIGTVEVSFIHHSDNENENLYYSEIKLIEFDMADIIDNTIALGMQSCAMQAMSDFSKKAGYDVELINLHHHKAA